MMELCHNHLSYSLLYVQTSKKRVPCTRYPTPSFTELGVKKALTQSNSICTILRHPAEVCLKVLLLTPSITYCFGNSSGQDTIE